MLTITEILAELRRNARGRVENRTVTVRVATEAEAVVKSKRRAKADVPAPSRDVPMVALVVGNVEAVFTVDELDPSNPRWTFLVTGGKGQLSGVVNGIGDVLRVADLAHELAGLGRVKRNAPPMQESAPLDTRSPRARHH